MIYISRDGWKRIEDLSPIPECAAAGQSHSEDSHIALPHEEGADLSEASKAP